MARVHEQPADEVGVLLVLLEVKTLGAAEDFPIDVLDVVAGAVFAVLGELDGEAVVRATVLAGKITFDGEAGLQLQSADLSEDERVQIIDGRFGHLAQPAFTG